MRGFLLLIQFMTRIPVPIKIKYNSQKVGISFKFFPLIGALIGILLSLVYFSISFITPNKLIISIFVVTAEVIVTGGIHLDGLADTFDAIFSYRSREKMLEIMKDSRIGSNGVLILIIYLIAKTAFLTEVNWKFILVMPIFARLNSVLNAGLGNYARKSGMGESIVKNTNSLSIFIAILISITISYYFLKIYTLIITLFTLIFGLWFLRAMNKKIGGITGDTLGAVVELSNLIVLFIGVILK